MKLPRGGGAVVFLGFVAVGIPSRAEEAPPPTPEEGIRRLNDQQETLRRDLDEVKKALQETAEKRQPQARGAAEGAPEETRRLLDRGARIYNTACSACHGERGNGNGPFARDLDPKPRDFTRARFKWRTTQSGALPTDEDLDRTLRQGVPGTSMPAWQDILALPDRRAVIAYLKTFSPKFSQPSFQISPEKIVAIPEAPPLGFQPDSARGRDLYVKMRCIDCHGEGGRGDGPSSATLRDDDDRPIRAYDFTRGYFRCGPGDADLFRAFTTGLNGTPMPSFEGLMTDEERWHLVTYVRSLSPPKDLWYRLFVEEPGRSAK